MAINLIRANSEIPNVHNYDDSRILRYAFCDKGAIVKNYRNQLALTIDGSNVHIDSGEIVFQGWQCEVDSVGVDFSLTTTSGTEYYLIYLEIDLSLSTLQTAELKIIKNTYYLPTIDSGDDLTNVKDGVARLPIYNIKYISGTTDIITYELLIPILDYASNRLDYLEANRQYSSRKSITSGEYALVLTTNDTTKEYDELKFNPIITIDSNGNLNASSKSAKSIYTYNIEFSNLIYLYDEGTFNTLKISSDKLQSGYYILDVEITPDNSDYGNRKQILIEINESNNSYLNGLVISNILVISQKSVAGIIQPIDIPVKIQFSIIAQGVINNYINFTLNISTSNFSSYIKYCIIRNIKFIPIVSQDSNFIIETI